MEKSTSTRKQGFQVAARAKTGAYTGKAKKIKRNLIQKAKLKKSYHKLLKNEGYGKGREETLEDDGSPEKASEEESTEENDNSLRVAKDTSASRKLSRTQEQPKSLSEPMGSTSQKPPERAEHSSAITKPEFISNHSKLHPSRRPYVPPTKADKKAQQRQREKERKAREVEKQARIEDARKRRAEDSNKWKEKTKKGQPKLGKRVDVLLGQIQRRGL
ncbi:hypothetical protein BT69DRAFT_1350592 [Atractiella rhizophila]|nr:hypothetical protein BT69DRAFT_1350592 [Atractiella rhizophila]